MTSTTVTSKGQVTIPLEVRERYGIEAGTKLEIVPIDDLRFEVYPKNRSVLALSGIFRHEGTPVTLEEMDVAIGDHLAEKDAQSRR